MIEVTLINGRQVIKITDNNRYIFIVDTFAKLPPQVADNVKCDYELKYSKVTACHVKVSDRCLLVIVKSPLGSEVISCEVNLDVNDSNAAVSECLRCQNSLTSQPQA